MCVAASSDSGITVGCPASQPLARRVRPRYQRPCIDRPTEPSSGVGAVEHRQDHRDRGDERAHDDQARGAADQQAGGQPERQRAADGQHLVAAAAHLAVGVLDRAAGGRRRVGQAGGRVGRDIPDRPGGIGHGAAQRRRAPGVGRAIRVGWSRSGCRASIRYRPGWSWCCSFALSTVDGPEMATDDPGRGPGPSVRTWLTPRHWRFQAGR